MKAKSLFYWSGHFNVLMSQNRYADLLKFKKTGIDAQDAINLTTFKTDVSFKWMVNAYFIYEFIYSL